MANYTTTANVVLSVNGKQAQKMLATLEKDAKRLERELAKASTAGDKASMKKLQRELKSTQRIMEQLKGSSSSVDATLRRLDKATPKELNKVLKLLQQQLNGIQRGTATWDAQIAKIKAVKAELQKVNATLATQKSLWSRMNTWLNNAQTAIMAFAAAVTGLVMAGRKAVQSYADMEEQMANTIKYTRMTAAEVEELNEIFKGMDTRLPREQLNLLAQEGGRLGYNTVASVREYVEAASIINVALVDLGEGATQTIAKLSNIFGMEQMYGVRDAMLKVGSTVNHLSQNCTAAKPFIVEFAQRMAGIGSTAKMTIPEIMAFAATLDAHGQKVEMSATALQRTIMELFKKPAEMARKVGLETNSFIETLNKSTTQGVMMFLEALHRLGEDQALAVLSPLFQDLGLDGARVSSVLSNLSSHLDFLKWQLGEANQAFKEGTSASNEYAIFNNTVQASIDKARKRVSELAIELGEKLYPLMKHIYTSSSVFLRVLNSLVSFIIEHRAAIGRLIIVISSYYAALLLTKTAHLAYTAVVKIGIGIQKLWQLAVISSRIVVLAFTKGLGAATHAFKLLTTVMKSNPFGMIAAAVSAVVVGIQALLPKVDEYAKKCKELLASAKGTNEEMVKEQHNLDVLFGRLKGTTEGTDEYKKAKDAIISQYGKYMKDLIDERGRIIDLERAYNRLADAVRRAAKERGIAEAEDEINKDYYKELSDYLTNLQASLEAFGASTQEAASLVQRVSSAFSAGRPLDSETEARINALSANTPTKDMKGNALNRWQGRLANSALWNWGIEAPQPAEVVNQMWGKYETHEAALQQIEGMRDGIAPLRHLDDTSINWMVKSLQQVIESGQTGYAAIHSGEKNIIEMTEVTVDRARQLLSQYQDELAYRGAQSNSGPDIVAGNPDFSLDDFQPYETEKDRKARETEARRAAIKARQDFKEALNATKGVWETADTQNTVEYTSGLKSWSDYLLRKHELEMQYFEDREAVYRRFNLTEDEDYQELLKKKAEAQAAWLKKNAALKVEDAKRQQQAEETQAQMDFYTPGNELYGKEEALQQKLFEIRIKYLKQMQAAYNNASEEWHNYQVQIEQAEATEQLRRQKLLAQRVAEWKKQYEYLEAKKRYDLEEGLLLEAYDKNLISYEEFLQAQADLRKKYATEYLPQSARPDGNSPKAMDEQKRRDLDRVASLEAQGVISHEQAEKAKERISRNYEKKRLDAVRRFGSQETNQLLDIYEAWKNFFDSTEEDGGNWATRLAALASSVFSVMNAGMQQYSEYVSACAELETAKVEKKYDREIELAEGNSYKVKKAEKEKEAAKAKIKNEANKKMFAMQVIQAVAQTATNALNAYGSAAAVPVIGYILAPIAAAMAVAAGALQIATIKKQQQASEAQGYQSGGFTPDGKPDEVAGVVHAGEWVASQKLVKSPQTRPLIEALDYAQRNNTLGSITHSDVSRSITAPMMIAAQPQSTPAPAVTNIYTSEGERNGEYAVIMKRLADRLDEPFVTVNTVTGDHGIQRAQEEYDKLMRNKAPKSRK